MAGMTDSFRRIEVSRLVAAAPERIFAFLARPENHRTLDTSGMIRGCAAGGPLTAVGQVFVMDMHNDMRGDHQVENHVVVLEPDRAVGWAPAEPGRPPAGHVFVWRLTPDPSGGTVVSQTYDWSAFTHLDMLDHLPVLDRDQLMRSVDRLAEAVTDSRVRQRDRQASRVARAPSACSESRASR